MMIKKKLIIVLEMEGSMNARERINERTHSPSEALLKKKKPFG